MKIIEILEQIRSRLPFHTNYFNTQTPITSLTSAPAGPVTAVTMVTATPHNLVVGKDFNVTDAISGLVIDVAASEATRSGSVITFTTLETHDLTGNMNNFAVRSGQACVEILNAGVPFDGLHAVTAIPNKNSFTVNYTTTLPPLTGAPIAFDGITRGFNGRFIVKDVIDINTLVYEISDSPYPNVGSPVLHTVSKTSGAVTIDRCLQLYTKQDPTDAWLFVSGSNDTISRDRSTESDVMALRHQSSYYRMVIEENFDCFIFVPASSTEGGAESHDLMEDLEVALISSLAGYIPASKYKSDERLKIVYTGSGFEEYNRSILIKRYSFQVTRAIILDDTYIERTSISMKKINIDYGNTLLSNITLNKDGSL